MAKYFKSDKEEHSSNSVLAPLAEKEKAKQSILKVFRARQHSPCSEHQNYKKKVPRCAAAGQETANKDMNREDQAEEKTTVNHKVKKRKTRAERDKLRNTKVPEKCMHINRTTENSTTITQSRLTRRLGLFNHGKKSHTIVREPLVVPESVKARTDADLLRILDLSEAGLDHPICIPKLKEKYSTLGPKPHVIICSDKDVTSECASDEEGRVTSPVLQLGSQSAKSCFSFQSHSPQDNHVMEVDCLDSPKASPNSFPSSPDIPGIANFLLSDLLPSSLTMGRDLLKETRSDLFKLLKRNAPKNSTPLQETPMNVKTPSSHGSVTSGTVKRSLMESLSTPQKTNPVHVGHKCKPLPTARSEVESDVLMMEDSAPSLSVDALMDAKSLLDFNDKAMITKSCEQQSAEEEFQKENSVGGHNKCASVFHQSDIMPRTKEISNRQALSQMYISNPDEHGTQGCLSRYRTSTSHHPPVSDLHHRGCVPQDHNYVDRSNTLASDVSYQGHQVYQSSICCQHNCSHGDVSQGENKGAVVTQYVYTPQHAIGQSRTCSVVSHHLPYDPHIVGHQQHLDMYDNAGSSMDILDDIDHYPEIAPCRQRELDMMGAETLYLIHQKMLKQRSSDSDSSPSWLPAVLPLRRPPSGSPSPPQKLYPHRLY